jgi:hypothetical protein
MLENWARATPGLPLLDQGLRRITHIARLKPETAADSVDYLYRALAAWARSAARSCSSFRRR